MKLYRIFNTKNHGVWVIADNPKKALEIGMKIRHAKRIENLKVVDQTDFYLNRRYKDSLKKVLSKNVSGVAYIKIPSVTIEQILKNQRSEYTESHGWHVSAIK